ncbi:hypothetical protein HAX54_019157, partial [Datura stramonium]|nr:hypothetical protein [Datura stramonium]
YESELLVFLGTGGWYDSYNGTPSHRSLSWLELLKHGISDYHPMGPSYDSYYAGEECLSMDLNMTWMPKQNVALRPCRATRHARYGCGTLPICRVHYNAMLRPLSSNMLIQCNPSLGSPSGGLVAHLLNLFDGYQYSPFFGFPGPQMSHDSRTNFVTRWIFFNNNRTTN